MLGEDGWNLASPRPGESVESRSWDRWAALYRLQESLEKPALRALAEMLAAHGLEGPLLDVATGTGAMLEALTGVAHPPPRAVGIDASPRMLARVGRLPSGWRVVEGDARGLPFGDAEFSAATAAYLLHTLDRRDAAAVLAEIRRVLVPGGRLGVITVAPPSGVLGGLLRSPLSRLGERSSGALAGLRPLDPRPALVAAGFASLAGRRITRGYPSFCVVAERR